MGHGNTVTRATNERKGKERNEIEETHQRCERLSACGLVVWPRLPPSRAFPPEPNNASSSVYRRILFGFRSSLTILARSGRRRRGWTRG